jgi:hypothetical protein
MKFRHNSSSWRILNYFDMAVESCVLATKKNYVYNKTCQELGVSIGVSPTLDRTILFADPGKDGPLSSVVLAVKVSPGSAEEIIPQKNRYPWLCSLRTTGYTKTHKCGVSLISGPPRPTIFVSAAHCNFLCKVNMGQTVDNCCCQMEKEMTSCAGSDFCGTDPTYQLAKAGDLQIACM